MTSALDRLRTLPEAFTFAAFCKLSRFSNNAAAVCLRRWQQKGLIEAAGERAQIYFNRLKAPEVDGSLRVSALLFEYPSAMLIGESALHAAGWITQIPASRSIAVLARRSYVSFHGFEIHGRSISWFRSVHPFVDPSAEKRVYGLRALPAPFALADLYADPHGWHPDLDDLHIPDEDGSSVLLAARQLDAQLPAPLLATLNGPPRARSRRKTIR